MNEIVAYMKHRFDRSRFVVRERVMFLNDMQRKSREIVPKWVARDRPDGIRIHLQHRGRSTSYSFHLFC